VNKREFPWLKADQYYPFPHPSTADSQGLVAMGGNLSPGMLISAYAQGLFPWYNENEPLLWWSLDPRFLLYPDDLYISKSMKKFLKKKNLSVSMDRNFAGVIRNCQQIKRKGMEGTWITGDMEKAYLELHRLGFAHSVEIWLDEELAGGLYGVSLGRAFFGESMFSRVSNASKAALIHLTRFLKQKKFPFVDCQQHTAHLESMGAVDVPRDRFLEELDLALQNRSLIGNWAELFDRSHPRE